MRRIFTTLLLVGNFLSFAQNYSVQLHSGSFMPSEKALQPQLPGETVNGRYYRVVQFYQIPTEEQKHTLAAKGVLLYNYLPNFCFMASLPSGLSVSELNNGPNIRSIFLLEPKYKLTEDLASQKYPSRSLRGKGNIELVVLHHPDISTEQVAEMLQTEGANINHLLTDQDGLRITVKIADLEKISKQPYLYFLEPADGDPIPDNLVGRTDHRSNYIADDRAGGLKYDGTGVSVALNDDGVIGPHIDYTGRIINQFITTNNGNHGDHCAGTIFGAGNINPTTKGMAFGAQLGVYGVGGVFANYYQAFDSIYSHYNKHNIRITSTSYSDGNNTGYTSRARLMDIHINAMPDLIHVFSAGNAGTSNFNYGAGAGWGNVTGGHKQAKNVIAVGNLTFDDFLASSSSRGPAKDGRIKPEICAVGTNVNSTVNPNTYQSMTGTSMACPGVAGTVAQLYHAYKDMNSGANPPSALIKACILNTGDDLGNPGPDFKHGYGRINARRALGVLQNNQYLIDSVTQSGSKQHTITVPANVAELRVMVYWHDKEATANAAKALVNNLDMTVTTPSAQVVNPWVLNKTPNATLLNTNATQGTDTLNNMEQVTIPNPAAGNYTVTVAGFAVPSGPQRYVVVYEFVKDEITVTYPKGGESVVPNIQETIRWDAVGNTGNFTVQYSTNNGASWNTISTSVAGTSRHYNWSPPSTVTGQALIRISRAALSDQSDTTFSIIGVPTGLTIDWVCVDSFKVSYNPVTGATGYIVTALGSMYMDSVGFSTTPSCIVKGVNTASPGWYSVQAVGPNGCIGRRAIAQQRPAVPVNCIINDDLGMVSVSSPSDSSVVNCQFTALTENIAVQIKNNSVTPINNTVVKYSVNGGAPVVENYSGVIPGQFQVTHTFSMPVVFHAPGVYTIKIWLENSQDTNPANDTIELTKHIVQPPLFTLPFREDFETFVTCDTSASCELEHCVLNTGWLNELNGVDDDIDWRIHSGPTPTQATSGTTGPVTDWNPGTATGQYAYLEAGDCYGKTAGLVFPCVDLSNASFPALSFAYHMYGSGVGSLHVDALVNGVWTNDIMPAINGGQTNNWIVAMVPLIAYQGQVISLRIRGVTGTNEAGDIAIDDIAIDDFLSVSTLTTRALQIFPNPSEGIFNIQWQQTGRAELRVTDLNGKTVLQQEANGRSAVIDLKNYATGVYLLTVRFADGVVTKKLIRQ